MVSCGYQVIWLAHRLPESLIERIAASSSRNKLIVNTYLEQREKYGKTLIFAMNMTNFAILYRIIWCKTSGKAWRLNIQPLCSISRGFFIVPRRVSWRIIGNPIQTEHRSEKFGAVFCILPACTNACEKILF